MTGAEVRSGRAAVPAGSQTRPLGWWKAMLDAIAAAGGFADVSAFGVAAVGSGMVALDTAGHLVPGAFLPQGPDDAAAAKDLIAETGIDRMLERIGSMPTPDSALARLRVLRDRHPENAGRIEAVASHHDWLTWRLRGFGPADEMPNGLRLEELVTDRSDASTTGYWNPATGKWDHVLFDTALGEPAIKPRIMPPDAWGGESWKMPSHGIKSERVISIGGRGAALAAFGLGAAPGDILVFLDDEAGVFTVSRTPVIDPAGRIACRADATGGFLPHVSTPGATRLLDAAARTLGVGRDRLFELADHGKPGAGGVVLLMPPTSPDQAAPREAQFRGQTERSETPENLARAAVEGMLCPLADAVDALAAAGLPARRILLLGDVSSEPVVQEAARQVFELPVSVVSDGDPVAGGAAAQAVWAKTHRRAPWSIPLSESRDPDPRPVIRDQFRWARARAWPAR
jgi:xylulokinase